MQPPDIRVAPSAPGLVAWPVMILWADARLAAGRPVCGDAGGGSALDRDARARCGTDLAPSGDDAVGRPGIAWADADSGSAVVITVPLKLM
jgi:hypothetical protein